MSATVYMVLKLSNDELARELEQKRIRLLQEQNNKLTQCLNNLNLAAEDIVNLQKIDNQQINQLKEKASNAYQEGVKFKDAISKELIDTECLNTLTKLLEEATEVCQNPTDSIKAKAFQRKINAFNRKGKLLLLGMLLGQWAECCWAR
ncbi:MAG TPA: hypothetical protein VHA13_02940 [Gammaproteobacteria bacterium]|nr:hypothetical protein [Gammaproteobacteria bacterium]